MLLRLITSNKLLKKISPSTFENNERLSIDNSENRIWQYGKKWEITVTLLRYVRAHSKRKWLFSMDRKFLSGAMEPGVLGVQLHIHFLTPACDEDQILSSNIKILK